MSFPKRVPYRNQKILDAARDELCTVETPDCRQETATVVAAHSNKGEHGKGKGQKADDCYVAFCCYRCHQFIDLKKPGYEFYEQRGRDRTLRRLLDKGVLK